MTRYTGNDEKRFFLVQRGDCKFWTGDGFSHVLDNAKVFRDHGTAATAIAALQYQQYKGKPVRAFRLESSIVLAADDVGEISMEALAAYIRKSLRLNMDNSVHGDGPVEGSSVRPEC